MTMFMLLSSWHSHCKSYGFYYSGFKELITIKKNNTVDDGRARLQNVYLLQFSKVIFGDLHQNWSVKAKIPSNSYL